MNAIPERYIWLAASLIAALILDAVVTRALLTFFRPTSAYVFWIGRAGKLAALLGWLIFFDSFWYPQFLGGGEATPAMVRAVEAAVLGVFALLAFASLPRRSSGKAGSNG